MTAASPDRGGLHAEGGGEGGGAKLLAGLMVLKSVKMARYVNEKIPGIFVPERLIAES